MEMIPKKPKPNKEKKKKNESLYIQILLFYVRYFLSFGLSLLLHDRWNVLRLFQRIISKTFSSIIFNLICLLMTKNLPDEVSLCVSNFSSVNWTSSHLLCEQKALENLFFINSSSNEKTLCFRFCVISTSIC